MYGAGTYYLTDFFKWVCILDYEVESSKTLLKLNFQKKMFVYVFVMGSIYWPYINYILHKIFFNKL